MPRSRRRQRSRKSSPAVDLAILKLALELHAVGALIDAGAVVFAALEVALVFGVVCGGGGRMWVDVSGCGVRAKLGG